MAISIKRSRAVASRVNAKMAVAMVAGVAPRSGGGASCEPAHTPLDGDLVFAVATGAVPLVDPVVGMARLGDAAARVLARAVARGVFSAASLPGHAVAAPLSWTGLPPAWGDAFGDA
jgi:L-aminopeptidase/D-esterase-like protein